jgi:hypothetical protein
MNGFESEGGAGGSGEVGDEEDPDGGERGAEDGKADGGDEEEGAYEFCEVLGHGEGSGFGSAGGTFGED